MLKIPLLLLFCFTFFTAQSQIDSTSKDSIIRGSLGEVIVTAYGQNRRLQDVPAAVNYIGRNDLSRYNNTSILPAINSTPGVRMEERSPGSYRLNIRGSSMRSPFGVRNVKVYFNSIPFTDPGGQTFLNQVGFYNVQSIEIIKGPGSSLYGAGTGGVMLLESSNIPDRLQLNYTTGSYNLQNIAASASIGNKDFVNTISLQHQQSDGYRQHTNMKRDVFAWNSRVRAGTKTELSTSFFYADLFYQTPGALTLNEYTQNPKAARPTIGATPGAVAAQAAVYQKTLLTGATLRHQFTNDVENTTTLYGALTQLKNPTTRNYGRNNEPHFGGRSTFQFKKKINNDDVLVHLGAELQEGFTNSRIFSNRGGNPDTLQTDDEINNRNAFVSSQVSFTHKSWLFTAGLSLNQLKVEFNRLSISPSIIQVRKYNNELAPRFAILKKFGDDMSAYASISKGFSPPTTSELLPGNGKINTDLNAERGINYEVGVKGSVLNRRLSYDITGFYFNLKNAIVQRRDATGGDFYINAGSTNQQGLESSIQYKVGQGPMVNQSKLWLAHTYNRFKYDAFKQLTNDFSGNNLPGIAKHTIAAGIDLYTKPGLYFNVTYFYSDPIYLNDANTATATSYHLLASRIGYKVNLTSKYRIEIFAGGENLFNVQYSLGNDLNAFGNRFYNAAPGRNYFGGVTFSTND